MKTRLTIHADFGPYCSGSNTALQYLQRILKNQDEFAFESKHLARSTPLGTTAQFDAVWQNPIDNPDDAEELIDDLHHSATSNHHYRNMELLDIELTAELEEMKEP